MTRAWTPLFLAALLLSGCSGINSITVGIEGTTEIDVADTSLQGDCELLRGSAQEGNESDPLKASVTVKSHLRHTRSFESRWRWYDAKGGLLATHEVTWHTFSLAPDEERTLSGEAPNLKARRARFELRYHHAAEAKK